MFVTRTVLVCFAILSWTSATYYYPNYRLRYPYVIPKRDGQDLSSKAPETTNKENPVKDVSPEIENGASSRVGEPLAPYSLNIPSYPIHTEGMVRNKPQQPPPRPPPGGAFGSYGQFNLPGFSLQFGGQGGHLGSSFSSGGTNSHLVSAGSYETPFLGGSHYLASQGNGGPISFPGEYNGGTGFGFVGGLFGGTRPVNSNRDQNTMHLNIPQIYQNGNALQPHDNTEVLRDDILYHQPQASIRDNYNRFNPFNPNLITNGKVIVVDPLPLVRRPQGRPQGGFQSHIPVPLPYSPMNQIQLFYPARPYGSQGALNHGSPAIYMPNEPVGNHATGVYHETENHGVYYQMGGNNMQSAGSYGNQPNAAHYGTGSNGVGGTHVTGSLGIGVNQDAGVLGAHENYPSEGHYNNDNYYGEHYIGPVHHNDGGQNNYGGQGGQYTPENYGGNHMPENNHGVQHAPVSYGGNQGQHASESYGGSGGHHEATIHGTDVHKGQKENGKGDIKHTEKPSAESSSTSLAEDTKVEDDKPTKVILMPTKFLEEPIAVPQEVEARYEDLELNRVTRGLLTQHDEHPSAKNRSADLKRAQNLKCSDCLVTRENSKPFHLSRHSSREEHADKDRDNIVKEENAVEKQ